MIRLSSSLKVLLLVSASVVLAACGAQYRSGDRQQVTGPSTPRPHIDGSPAAGPPVANLTVPKLALGPGSLALLRERGRIVEVLDPAGRLAARIALGDDSSVPLERKPYAWSPAGDTLLYLLPGDVGYHGIGVLDFSAGEDRLLWLPKDQEAAIYEAKWPLPDRIFLSLISSWMGYYGPYLWWSLDREGRHYGPFVLPKLPEPLSDYTDFQITAGTRDGKSLLLTLFWRDSSRGIKRSAVVRMDLASGYSSSAVQMISPADEHCDGGFFSRDGRRIFFTCQQGEVESPVVTLFMALNDGSQARRVMQLPPGAALFRESPDGETLILFSSEAPGLLIGEVEKRRVRPLPDLGLAGRDELQPLGFDPGGRRFWLLRVYDPEKLEYPTGDLIQVDVVTGRQETKATGVYRALLAR